MSCKILPNSISIASWNIQGIRTKLHGKNSSLGESKLNIPSIQKLVKKHDIICLQETWLKKEIDNFTGFTVHNTIQKTNSKRGCRGVALLIRNYLSPHIEIIASHTSNIIWCKLKKQSFGLEKDIFLGNIYLPPLQCQKRNNEDILSILEQDLMKHSQNGTIILLGDFNARTGILNDYIDNDAVLPNMSNTNIYSTDSEWPKRNNSDIIMNKQGEGVLNLCISHKLRILNGRTSGDFMGNLTCYQRNGASVVDYVIINETIWNKIIGLSINNLTPYSDHCPISLKLAVQVTPISNSKKKNQKLQKKENKKLTKYLWTKESHEKLIEAFQSEQIQNLIQNQFSQQDNDNIEEQLEKVNEIFHSTAKMSLAVKSTKSHRTQKPKRKSNKNWYTNECRYLKRKLKSLAKTINSSNYGSLKDEYYKIKKQYKNTIKKAHRNYKNKIISQITSLNEKNNTEFWKSLHQLKESNSEDPSIISEEIWIKHFKTLLQEESQTDYKQNVPYTQQNTHELDCEITPREIQTQLNKLKTNKAAGIDGISNEMLKHGRFYMVPIITKLFNQILKCGKFPKPWNTGLIKPIFKKGDRSLPSNYRGITLTSCLGKLFTSILQTRLIRYLEDNDLLRPEQFGFRPNSRTTDNIFILKQIINKHFRSGQNLYVAFVDYEKAFDTVWHSGLLHKIKQLGISGNFYNVIESMYSSITSSVLLENNTISESFICNKGIRQGDGLSPVLFSIFMNDLPEHLKLAKCQGTKIKNQPLNCLMFADDLLLISSSATDLQHSLDSLHDHAKKWKLRVNTSKTNIMIFNKQGKLIKDTHFKYDKQSVNVVDKQTYLGLTLTPSGKFNYTRELLAKKGLKIWATFSRMLSNCDYVPVKVHCKLFDSLVKPAILYGCEIWGPELLQYKTPFDKNPLEQLHIRFCKIILALPWYASNDSTRAELGRHPLLHDIKCNIYSYYLRLKHNVNNVILKNAFESLNTQTDFSKTCKHMIEIDSTPHESNVHKMTKTQVKSKRQSMLGKLKNNYQIEWLQNKVNYSSTFANKNKMIYNLEQYLTLIKNIPHRKALTKLRLGVHSLRIQTGKYENKGGPIPVNMRTCKLCDKGEIENEVHFIRDCPKYSMIREHYFKTISTLDTSFTLLSEEQKAHYILEANRVETCTTIGKYIHELFTERKKQLRNS